MWARTLVCVCEWFAAQLTGPTARFANQMKIYLQKHQLNKWIYRIGPSFSFQKDLITVIYSPPLPPPPPPRSSSLRSTTAANNIDAAANNNNNNAIILYSSPTHNIIIMLRSERIECVRIWHVFQHHRFFFFFFAVAVAVRYSRVACCWFDQTIVKRSWRVFRIDVIDHIMLAIVYLLFAISWFFNWIRRWLRVRACARAHTLHMHIYF